MLTARQKECLDFITGHIAATGGVSPSYKEIQLALATKSRGNVQSLVRNLIERGAISHLPGKARAITLLAGRQEYFVFDDKAKALKPFRPP